MGRGLRGKFRKHLTQSRAFGRTGIQSAQEIPPQVRGIQSAQDPPVSRTFGRTGDTTASAREDLALTQRRKIGPPEAQGVVTVTQEQLHRAGQETNRGWPAYEVIRGPIFKSEIIGTLARKMEG